MSEKEEIIILPLNPKVGDTFEVGGDGPWKLEMPKSFSIEIKKREDGSEYFTCEAVENEK